MEFSIFRSPNLLILIVNVFSFYYLLIYFIFIFFKNIYNHNYFYDRSLKQIITSEYYRESSEDFCFQFEGDSFPKDILEVIKSYNCLFSPNPYFLNFISLFTFSLIIHFKFKEIVRAEKNEYITNNKIINTDKEIAALINEIKHDSTKDNSTSQALFNNFPLANKEKKKKIIKLRELKNSLEKDKFRLQLHTSIDKLLINLQFYLINFIIFILDVNNYSKTCLIIRFSNLHMIWNFRAWLDGFIYLNIGFTFLFILLVFLYLIWFVLYMLDRNKAINLQSKLKNYHSVCFFYFYSIHLFILPRSLFDFNLKCIFYVIFIENYDYYILIYLVILFFIHIVIVLQLLKHVYHILSSVFYLRKMFLSKNNKIFDKSTIIRYNL